MSENSENELEADDELPLSENGIVCMSPSANEAKKDVHQTVVEGQYSQECQKALV